MNTRVTVTPAYGRDFKSAKASRESWNDKIQDWILQDITSPWDGKPLNKPQADEAGLVVILRYDRLRKSVPATPYTGKV